MSNVNLDCSIFHTITHLFYDYENYECACIICAVVQMKN